MSAGTYSASKLASESGDAPNKHCCACLCAFHRPISMDSGTGDNQMMQISLLLCNALL